MALDTVVWVGAGLLGERWGPREEEDRSWVRKYSGGQGMRWLENHLSLPCGDLRSLRVFMAKRERRAPLSSSSEMRRKREEIYKSRASFLILSCAGQVLGTELELNIPQCFSELEQHRHVVPIDNWRSGVLAESKLSSRKNRMGWRATAFLRNRVRPSFAPD
jgi:hypothetical protein